MSQNTAWLVPPLRSSPSYKQRLNWRTTEQPVVSQDTTERPWRQSDGSLEMLDHITIGVVDLERSKAFYDQALRPLGIERLYAEGDRVAGYGANQKPSFWVGGRNASQTSVHVAFVHVAFAAQDRETVDRFHQAALAAGGRDNGQPGLRPHYHANYYGAFVLDPDGHNIEAVCRRKIG
jgi:catechol 2,3-dioxygenase-like lactoylglutathione lyase family enzyme